MPGPATQVSVQQMLGAVSLAAERLNAMSLKRKIAWLRQNRSADPLQQMQSDAIAELYDAVRQLQEAVWPMLLLIPDTSGARDAASQGGAGASVSKANAAAPPPKLAAAPLLRRP